MLSVLLDLQVDEATGEAHDPEQLDQCAVAQSTSVVRDLVFCHRLPEEQLAETRSKFELHEAIAGFGLILQ